MKHAVYLTPEASDDLIDVYRYVATRDSVERADQLLDKLEDACRALSDFPSRGHVSPELERVGVFDFREIHVKPYRIIYEIVARKVYVHAVVDGRRDLQDLLQRRLLRG